MHVNKINDKKYIGITKTSVKKRWGCNGSGYNNTKQPLFYRAIKNMAGTILNIKSYMKGYLNMKLVQLK